MKKIFAVLVMLSCIFAVSADTFKKEAKRTHYGYKERYSIYIRGSRFDCYVPHYTKFEKLPCDDEMLVLLTFGEEISVLESLGYTCVRRMVQNVTLHPEVERLTKKRRLIIMRCPNKTYVVNFYSPKENRIATFVYR